MYRIEEIEQRHVGFSPLTSRTYCIATFSNPPVARPLIGGNSDVRILVKGVVDSSSAPQHASFDSFKNVRDCSTTPFEVDDGRLGCLHCRRVRAARVDMSPS